MNIYGVPNMRNVLLTGHTHTAKMAGGEKRQSLQDGTNFTAVTTPAMAPSNRYVDEQVIEKSQR